VGESVLTTEGETWRRLRRLEQPAFGRRHLSAISSQIVETAQTFLEERRDQAAHGAILDMVPAMKALTLRILGRAIFSLDLSSDAATIGSALTVLNTYALALFYHPLLPYFGPLSAHNRRGQAAQRDLDHIVFRLIRERRAQVNAEGPCPDDLLTFFLQLREEDGTPALPDAQIRNETLSLLIAGHDNSTSLLCWLWYLLAQHPNVVKRLSDEVTKTLKGRAPTFDDLERLPYIQMVVEETLRLYPPAWSFPRRVLADATIGGYTIPAGSTVLLSPYTTHRHPAFWPDPETFDPERFSANAQAERPRYAHFPFGGGQHQCMGAAFAMIEAQLVLAVMMQRYRLELVPGVQIHPEPLVTLRPRELPMRLQL
jgi:cytochrome P450